MFAAIAALERLRKLQSETQLDLTVDTPLVYHQQFEETAPVDRDETNVETHAITLRHEIRKLFLVSDNEAFNRLYEFVGQDRLNESMARAGMPNARIVHRLAEPRSAEENRSTPRIDFSTDNGVVFSLPSILPQPLPEIPPIAGLEVGKGYLSGDKRVDRPMDFSTKNRVSLHGISCLSTGMECSSAPGRWTVRARSPTGPVFKRPRRVCARFDGVLRPRVALAQTKVSLTLIGLEPTQARLTGLQIEHPLASRRFTWKLDASKS